MTHFKLTQQHKLNSWVEELFKKINNRLLISLFIAACITISLFTVFNGVCIGMPITVIGYALLFFILFCALAYLWHTKRFDNIVKTTLVLMVVAGINMIWFNNGGSSGPSLIIYLAFIPIIIFLFDAKINMLMIFIGFTNILILLILEYYHPHIVKTYSSSKQQLLDVYSNFILFVIMEVPILCLIRKYLINKAICAQKSEQLKTAFLSNISHEIRTPMNAVIGFTELLYDKTIDDDTRKYYLDIIQDNGHLLLKLINNVMEASQLESNSIDINKKEVVLNDFFPHVHNWLLKHVPPYKEISFKYNLPEQYKDSCIYADPEMIYRILSNLILNSIKFTTKGEIEFGVKSIDNDKKEIVFYVSDTGVGIPEEYQHYIFDTFFQGDFDINGKKDGIGLGLSNSYKLTKKLGGRMELKSKHNEGSTFWVYLKTE